jgi:hypothetical protein
VRNNHSRIAYREHTIRLVFGLSSLQQKDADLKIKKQINGEELDRDAIEKQNINDSRPLPPSL